MTAHKRNKQAGIVAELYERSRSLHVEATRVRALATQLARRWGIVESRRGPQLALPYAAPGEPAPVSSEAAPAKPERS